MRYYPLKIANKLLSLLLVAQNQLYTIHLGVLLTFQQLLRLQIQCYVPGWNHPQRLIDLEGKPDLLIQILLRVIANFQLFFGEIDVEEGVDCDHDGNFLQFLLNFHEYPILL